MQEEEINEKSQNKALKADNANLLDNAKKQEDEIKNLKAEAKDLKPDNDKLIKSIEELNAQNNELLNECAKLRQKPQQLTDEYEPQLAKLKEVNDTLKDTNEKVGRENESLKKDLSEIVDERKKRNADRRKRKEEHMKKIVDEAHRKLEDTRKKFDDKKNLIEATDLVKNAMLTQDDLKKYPEMQMKTPEAPAFLMEDDTQNFNIEDIGIDKAALEEPVVMYAGRTTSQRETGKQIGTQGPSFFEVTEPSLLERAPYQRIAMEPDSHFAQSLPPMEELEEPLFENNPMCPYGHGEEGYTGHVLTDKDRAIQNARLFLERAKHDPKLRELIERQFPGMNVDDMLTADDMYDFAVRLLLMSNRGEEVKAPPKMTREAIRPILDKKLRTRFTITAVPPKKLNAKLEEKEEVKVLEDKYEEILDQALNLIMPDVDARGTKTPTEAVNDSVEKNLKAIQEMFRKRKEAELPALPAEETKGDEDMPIMTPSSVAKAKIGGALLPKIMQILKSKQKEEVKEFRAVEKGTGKVTWNKTHFIFAIDCSGSMRGRRAKAVEQGFERCVTLLKAMPEIIVSSFTFDDKCTEYTRTIEPAALLKSKKKMTLTFGEKTDYKAALEKVISYINDDKAHEDYLTCIIFMSDGKGGYPDEEVKILEKMKSDGKKMLFITLACETEEDEDMSNMAQKMKGEHYKCTDADAMKTAFMKIIQS